MLFVSCTQGSPEWFAARAGVTTASTFADALSMVGGLDEKQAKYVEVMLSGGTQAMALEQSGYKAPPKAESVARALQGLPVGEPSSASLRLAMETAMELISGEPYGDTFQTYAMRRGQEQELFSRMRYEARCGVIVDEAGLVTTDDRWFGYSTDGFVEQDGCIEIKVPMDLSKVVNIIKTGDLSEYIHQIQGGLWITGRKWCDFVMGIPGLASLNNGNELYVKRVHRDEALIESMEQGLLAHRMRVIGFEKLLRTPFTTNA